jgi:CrcB protein
VVEKAAGYRARQVRSRGNTAVVGRETDQVEVPEPRRRGGTDPALLAAIFAGGAAGALARAGIGKVAPVAHGQWPWTTFALNVAGSFLLGYFAIRLQERLPPSTYRRPLLGTGFCGALTTFSTMQVETLRLVRADRPVLAAGYLLGSTTAGLVAVAVAAAATRRARLA